MARIIIADDDELTIDIVRAALEPAGHIVGALPDGSRVVEVVTTKRPDLVILDCAMPDVGGVAALRALRSDLRNFAVPVLMLTGRQGRADEGIAYEAGADDYLRKPFDPEELLFRVEALLDQHRKG